MKKFILSIVFIVGCLLLYMSFASKEQPSALMVSLGNSSLDIPVEYIYGRHPDNIDIFDNPSLKRFIGARKAITSIRIVALLPDVEPYSEENKHKFLEPGWVDKVKIVLTSRTPNWNYYFDNFSYRLKRLEPLNYLQHMNRYVDTVTKKETFISSDSPSDNLVMISCTSSEFNPRSPPFPMCDVSRRFSDDIYIRYYFGRKYIEGWPAIDKKIIGIVEGFVVK